MLMFRVKIPNRPRRNARQEWGNRGSSQARTNGFSQRTLRPLRFKIFALKTVTAEDAERAEKFPQRQNPHPFGALRLLRAGSTSQKTLGKDGATGSEKMRNRDAFALEIDALGRTSQPSLKFMYPKYLPLVVQ